MAVRLWDWVLSHPRGARNYLAWRDEYIRCGASAQADDAERERLGERFREAHLILSRAADKAERKGE